MRTKLILDWLLARFRTTVRDAGVPQPQAQEQRDPLDLFSRHRDDEWPATSRPLFDSLVLRKATDFPVFEPMAQTVAMDAATKVSDDSLTSDIALSSVQSGVPDLVQDWYSSQGFIGHQACAIIAQHWLVDKACAMPGEDAIRNGFELNVVDSSSGDNAADEIARLRARDEVFHVTKNCADFERFKNVFGVRICLFEVESQDPLYYEKPFNIDGVTKGSYKGMRQVDPYWCFPVLSVRGQADPTSRHFYDPEYWVINGKKFHRTHLVIGRGPEPADILKPTYMFGGVSLPQRIYERVYAAERTANEGPMLAMTKRTTTLHVDLNKATAKQKSFTDRIKDWVAYRDNYQVKVLGMNEQVEQHDTALGDLDSVIMTQYQLVAAIANVPATKLLGTSPKGFSSTGEFEEASYHEHLESIQASRFAPLLSRHYTLLIKSECETEFKFGISFAPVDSPTAKELAEINKTKADTGKLLSDAGVISPDEERNRVRLDPDSGYGFIDDTEAETELEGEAPGLQAKDAIYAPGPSPRLPKIKCNGFTLVIENPKGSIRSGLNLDGSRWSVMMPHHYGYVSGVLGADGDELDAFMGPAVASQLIFVINQNDPSSQAFDEHKVMFGFACEADALQAYLDSFDADWGGMGSCVQMSADEFRQWTATGDLTKEVVK